MSDLRDHLLDLLTDTEHEPGCASLNAVAAARGYPHPCSCLFARLARVMCQCSYTGPTGEDVDVCPSCERLADVLAPLSDVPEDEAPF